MPVPIAALIGAGAALAGSAINAGVQGKMNKRAVDYARESYNQQKADALSFWNIQNEYNSPQEQMKRFQSAGLNPNLIYGQGNSGPAGAVQAPSFQHVQFQSSRPGEGVATAGLSYMNAIYDLDIKKAQADNLKAQNSVILQDALLRAAQIDSTKTGTANTQFDLGFKSDLRDTSADTRREALRQMTTQIEYMTHNDARQAAANSQSVQEAFERTKNLVEQRKNMELQRAHTVADISRIHSEVDRIRENIGNLQRTGVLQDLEIGLRKQNVSYQDPLWQRVVARTLSDVFSPDTPEGFIGQMVNGVKSIFTH